MTCPSCKTEYTLSKNATCPRCGHRLTSGVIKSSMILIGSGGKPAVYRSVSDVPEPLRGRLIESTRGLNSATLVIADQRGRKELSRAIKNLPSADAAEVRAERVYRVALRMIGVAIVLSTVALLLIAMR
jgi:hypothetical protein